MSRSKRHDRILQRIEEVRVEHPSPSNSASPGQTAPNRFADVAQPMAIELLLQPLENLRHKIRALENADYMDIVKVKNIKSGKIIIGFAKNKKKVVLKTKQF